MRKLLKLFIIFYCGYCSAATLSHRELSTGTFELTLKSEIPLEISQAQSSIYPSAIQLCKGKNPLFGKYSFHSSESISKDSDVSSFTFQQEIKCTDKVTITAAPKKLELSTSQEETIKSTTEKMTVQFLSAKESGEFKKAYDFLGQGMKSIYKFPAWESKESKYFSKNLGKLVSRDIWRITLYNNPPNSPRPGLYIAADYENSYEKSPIHCGYVMWFQPTADSDVLTVMREEYGSIPGDALSEIPKESLQDVKKKIGCRAF